MKQKILFVISDPQESQDFAHSLVEQHQLWDLIFVKTAAEAWEVLKDGLCNAVVSDFTLSDGNGMEFLGDVMQCHPKVSRIILANLEDKEAAIKCVGAAHQILARPCDAKRLKAALSRALETTAWVPSETARALISKMKRLPSPPYIYFRVTRELRMPEPSVDSIGGLIARDLVMSAKLLQAANSAALGLSLEVVTPAQAILYLGFETTQALILLAHGCSFYNQVQTPMFSIDQVWNHSIRTGQIAQRISKSEKTDTTSKDEAFTAGLLHDIGKLVLAANLAEKFRETLQLVCSRKLSQVEAEKQVLGTTHAEVGGCLLAAWGLPWSIVEAVALHHTPIITGKPAFSALTAVHVANALEQENNAGIDMNYLAELGLASRVNAWKILV